MKKAFVTRSLVCDAPPADMSWIVRCFIVLVLCSPCALAQSVYIGDSQYPWCPPPSADRSINVCEPADAQSATRWLPISAAVRDTHWPISYELILNGRSGFVINPDNEDIDTFIELDPVSSPQTVTLRVYDAIGSFEKSFTAYNVLTPPCTPPTADPSVALCSPANNATLTSPIQIAATATDSSTNTLSWVIYIDGQEDWTPQGPDGTTHHNFARSLRLYKGKHRVTAQAHENGGTVNIKATTYVNITSPTGCRPTAPGVRICSPGTSASGSQLHVVAKAYNRVGSFKWMQIYLDRKKAYTARNASIDTYIPITPGTHRLTVTDTILEGTILKTYSATEYVTVQ